MRGVLGLGGFLQRFAREVGQLPDPLTSNSVPREVIVKPSVGETLGLAGLLGRVS
jgi:hypothetical protein